MTHSFRIPPFTHHSFCMNSEIQNNVHDIYTLSQVICTTVNKKAITEIYPVPDIPGLSGSPGINTGRASLLFFRSIYPPIPVISLTRHPARFPCERKRTPESNRYRGDSSCTVCTPADSGDISAKDLNCPSHLLMVLFEQVFMIMRPVEHGSSGRGVGNTEME